MKLKLTYKGHEMRKWKLKKDDFLKAKKYLNKKIEEFAYLEHLNYDTKYKAKDELRKVDNATMLQEWIEKYLEKEQIQKLRTSLRVEKSRSGKHLQTITLNADTRARLANYAKRNNVTLSNAIDMLLEIADNEKHT